MVCPVSKGQQVVEAEPEIRVLVQVEDFWLDQAASLL